MLTGSSYNQMLGAMYPGRAARAAVQPIDGAEHLGTILHQLGLEAQIVDPNVTKLKHVKEPLLIWLRPQTHSNIGHLAVWDPESRRILDPKLGPSKRFSLYEQRAFVFVKF